MCTIAAIPVTAKIITGVASVVGTGVSMYSSIQQGKQQQAAAEYNKRVTENNAQRALNKSTDEENRQRLKTAMLVGKQRAQLGAANVNLFSGSAAQLQSDTQTLGEADALRIRNYGEDSYAASMEKADYYDAQADAASTSAKIGVAGSLLSAASSVANSGVADKWFSSDSMKLN